MFVWLANRCQSRTTQRQTNLIRQLPTTIWTLLEIRSKKLMPVWLQQRFKLHFNLCLEFFCRIAWLAGLHRCRWARQVRLFSFEKRFPPGSLDRPVLLRPGWVGSGWLASAWCWGRHCRICYCTYFQEALCAPALSHQFPCDISNHAGTLDRCWVRAHGVGRGCPRGLGSSRTSRYACRRKAGDQATSPQWCAHSCSSLLAPARACF